MTKLKTLKELVCKPKSAELGITTDKELKAEAVKWVKDLNMSHQIREDGLDMSYCEGMLQWIKHFFNLTEEDLKEKDE